MATTEDVERAKKRAEYLENLLSEIATLEEELKVWQNTVIIVDRGGTTWRGKSLEGHHNAYVRNGFGLDRNIVGRDFRQAIVDHLIAKLSEAKKKFEEA